MHLRASFSNFTDKPVTDNDIQMENYSQKE
jgi:hypothetical protein